MKVLFVYAGYESLGIEYISSVLKKAGHETRLIYDPGLFDDDMWLSNKCLARLFDFKKYLIEPILTSNADLIVFSVVTDYYEWACNMAREIKRYLKTPIVFGGIHPTSVPEEVIKNEFVDFVVVGEGEYAMLDLVNMLQSGKIDYKTKNIWLKKKGKVIKNDVRPLIQNLDSLPFPDKGIFRPYVPNKFSTYIVTATRGCPHECTYCVHSYQRKLYHGKGKYLRRRSVDNVINELKIAKQKYKCKAIVFYDDTFNFDNQWLKEFVSKYKSNINLPFFCSLEPNNITEEMINLLKKARCCYIEIGVQSLNEDAKRKYLNRYETNKQIEYIISLLNKHHIYSVVDIILGLPMQDENELLNTILFFNKNRVDELSIPWLKYYPKTRINKLVKQNLDNDKVSFTYGGDAYLKRFGKLHFLLYLTCILPEELIHFFVRKKMYKYLPATKYNYFIAISLIKIKNILRRKHIPSFLSMPQHYLFFMSKKILYTLKLSK